MNILTSFFRVVLAIGEARFACLCMAIAWGMRYLISILFAKKTPWAEFLIDSPISFPFFMMSGIAFGLVVYGIAQYRLATFEKFAGEKKLDNDTQAG